MRYIILLIAVLILTGCITTAKKDTQLASPALLEPSAMLKFADIPYPGGFKLLPKDSYTFENAGFRVGVLKYQGKASADQVVNFYKEQMLIYSWSLLNSVEYGQRLLNFDREQETCIVQVLPKWNATLIIITIGPKSHLPKKTEKPLK